MRNRIRKTAMKICLILMAAVVLMLPAGRAQADAPQEHSLDMASYTFTASDNYPTIGPVCSDDIAWKSWVSTDDNVAIVNYLSGKTIVVEAKRPGTCTITFYDTEDPAQAEHTAKIDITVTKEFMENLFKEENKVGRLTYGASFFEVEGWQGTKYTITAGGKKYTGTVGKTGYAKVSTKKVFKLNTKVKYTLTNGELSCSGSAKIKSGVWACASAKKKNKKKLTLTCYDLHKGDTVAVTYKNKKYKQSVTKNYDEEEKDLLFTLSKKMTKSGKLTVKITNRFKQTLLNTTLKMKNYDTGHPYADD